MRLDNELCFIYTLVTQCCYVTMYWLLQTNTGGTVAQPCVNSHWLSQWEALGTRHF